MINSIEDVLELIKQVTSEGRTKKSSLDLLRNKITDTEIKHIADAIASGRLPNHLSINLVGNDFTEAGLKYLSDALKSTKVPEHLSIRLGHNNITELGFQHLADALSSGLVRSNLSISLQHNNVGNKMKNPEAGIKHLAGALASGKAPAHLSINLSAGYISNIGVMYISDALASGNAPEHLFIDLSNSIFTEAGMKYIVDALFSGNAPKHLFINLIANRIEKKALRYLADALLGSTIPIGLGLEFNSDEEAYIQKILSDQILFVMAYQAASEDDFKQASNAMNALNTLWPKASFTTDIQKNKYSLSVKFNDRLEEIINKAPATLSWEDIDMACILVKRLNFLGLNGRDWIVRSCYYTQSSLWGNLKFFPQKLMKIKYLF